MATEVSLIMASLARAAPTNAYQIKLQTSLHNLLEWLEAHANEALSALPPTRDLSFLEVTLFCLVTHLEFRSAVPVADYPALLAFCERFGARASARETAYRFDG